jgi:hypothetical protein
MLMLRLSTDSKTVQSSLQPLYEITGFGVFEGLSVLALESAGFAAI